MDIPIALDPAWIVVTILGLIAMIECILLIKVMGILRTFSKMVVLKSRITADGRILLNEPDIPEFIGSTMTMIRQVQDLLSWVFGYLIDHPSTGWIKGYEPQIRSGVDAAIQQLATEAGPSEYVIETVSEPQTETVGQPG